MYFYPDVKSGFFYNNKKMSVFKPKQETIILSVGGSLIVPNGGIDIAFLAQLNQFIRKQVAKGRRFFIVVGGGAICRLYQDAGKQVIGKPVSEDLDWLGVHATRLNAHLIRTIFQDIAHPRIIENYDKKLTSRKEPIVIGAGWKPGWSTDYDAVMLANDYKASIVINLSNIDGVYDADPKKNKNAKLIKRATWDYFETLVGTPWLPGTNAPFDAVAAQFAKRIGLTVIVVNGKNFRNLEKVLDGENFKGTIITPKQIDDSFFDREYFEGKKGEYRLACTESVLGRNIQTLANYYRALIIKLYLKPKKCLDVGCGTGKLVYFLRKFGIEAYGVDVSKYAIEKADKTVKQYLKEGGITNIPYNDNTFDLIVSFDVLEHLERPKLRKALDESIRVSKKWILHKIYTYENKWISSLHSKDLSHLSVMSESFWLNMFKSIENVSVVKTPFFKLPSFFETIFLLKKK